MSRTLNRVHSPRPQPILRKWRLIGDTRNECRYKDLGGFAFSSDPRGFIWNLREVRSAENAFYGGISFALETFAKCIRIGFRFGRTLCLAQKLNPNSGVQRWGTSVVHHRTSDPEIPVSSWSKFQIASWHKFNRNIGSIHFESFRGCIGGTSGGVCGADALASLDGTEHGDDSYEHQGYTFNDKSITFAGVCLAIGGFVVFYKPWWKISFNLPANPNIAAYAAGVIASLGCAAVGILLF